MSETTGDPLDEAGAPGWRAAYHAVTLAALAVGVPAVLVAGLFRPRWREGLGERLGRVPRLGGRPAWFQAASVGEVRAFEALARQLRHDMPDVPLALSVTTSAGRQTAEALEPLLAAPPFRLPLDAAPVVARALRRLAPRAFVAVETELWPNLIRASAARGVPVALVNGRVSSRSFGRYRRVRPLLRDALSRASVLAMRTAEDAARIVALGAVEARVTVTGDLKFDAAGDAESLPDLAWAAAAGLGRGPWIVFASTAEGEEAAVLSAYRRVVSLVPDVRAVLAPRRPERWDEVAEMARQSGFPVVRRSRAGTDWNAGPIPPGGVLLLDTLGELARLYRHAEVVFVGGSLVPRGGHNLLEPAAAGRPVLFGPHVGNHRDAERALLAARGGLRVSEETLATEIVGLLADDGRRRDLGAGARQAVRSNVGATRRTVALLAPLLEAGQTPRGERGGNFTR